MFTGDTHHLPLRLRRHAGVAVDQRLRGLWEGVGHTVAETLTQTGPEKHNTVRTFHNRRFQKEQIIICSSNIATFHSLMFTLVKRTQRNVPEFPKPDNSVCVTCFGWIVACSPCVRRSAWCFWLRTRRSCRGRVRGGWCERVEPRSRTRAANTPAERADTSRHLELLQTPWNQEKLPFRQI